MEKKKKRSSPCILLAALIAAALFCFCSCLTGEKEPGGEEADTDGSVAE